MVHQSSDPDDDVASYGTHYVRASDIGSFVYCHRSWWLARVVGLEPDALLRRQRGTRAHQQHAWLVWLMQVLRIIGLSLAIIALSLAAWMWLGWLP